MGLKERVENVYKILASALKDKVIELAIVGDFIRVKTTSENVLEIAKELKKLGFDHVKSVTAVDYIKEERFEILYHISSYLNQDFFGVIVELAYDVPRAKPTAKSLYNVWKSVDFWERETYEMFGVVFEGHPDLRPLLLDEELAKKHPMRKDFIVKEEGIFIAQPRTEKRY